MKSIRVFGPLLVVWTAAAGCSAMGEADRVDQTLTRKMDTLTASLKTELRDMRNDLRNQERRHDEMAKVLDSLKTVIYSNTESLRRSNEGLERETKALIQSMADEIGVRAQLAKDHEQVQRTIQGLTKSVETLTPLAGELDAQVKQVTGVLQENYRSELRLLKERLRLLEEMTKQSGDGHVQAGPHVGEQGGKPPQESRVRTEKDK